jgi:hypothetical protein
VQGTPGNDPDSVVASRRQHFQLDLTSHEVVDGLLADQAEQVVGCRRVVGLTYMPAGEIRRAHVEHLALADEQTHRLPDLLPGGVPVDVVHLVEVDTVGLQPAQGILARLPDGQGRQLPVVGPFAHGPVDLGGQHGPVAAPASAGEPVTEDLLGPAGVGLTALADLARRSAGRAVPVGGVEEVDPRS